MSKKIKGWSTTEIILSGLALLMISSLFVFVILNSYSKWTSGNDNADEINVTITRVNSTEERFFENETIIKNISIRDEFYMAGLEELSQDYIFNFIAKKENLQNFCYRGDDCLDNKIFHDYLLIGYDYRSPYDKELEILKQKYGQYPLIYSQAKVTAISSDNNDIRVDGDKVKNLRYDRTKIQVSMYVDVYNYTFILKREREVCT